MNNKPDTQGATDGALAERFNLMRQADSALVPAFPTQQQLETQQPVAVTSAFSGAPRRMAVAASVVAVIAMTVPVVVTTTPTPVMIVWRLCQ